MLHVAGCWLLDACCEVHVAGYMLQGAG